MRTSLLLLTSLVLLVSACSRSEPLTLAQLQHVDKIDQSLRQVENGDLIVYRSGSIRMVTSRYGPQDFEVCTLHMYCEHWHRNNVIWEYPHIMNRIERIVPFGQSAQYCQTLARFADRTIASNADCDPTTEVW